MNDLQHRVPHSQVAYERGHPPRVLLKLYVSGQTSRSQSAVEMLRQICEANGRGWHLEVIDVLEHPERARDANVLATPTLVKELPPPMRTIVGDLDQIERVLVGLDLDTEAGSHVEDWAAS